MHTLYLSTTSPYTRILLMIAKLEQVDLALKFVTPWDNPAELTAVNSFSQVPALLLDTGEVITETPLIIQAIAPQVYTNTTTDLPNIAKAFGILAQGVRAFSTERFTPEGHDLHPFVARSTELLQTTLPNLPTLSATSTAWGDRVLMSALIWIGVRLPHVFETLSDTNKQAVNEFHQSPLMQRLNADVLENKPSWVGDL
ncbi:MAG: glutathione S-transferase N-terminal domain-containing protein [Moraxella sp.]|uniref:glutathione S-transferase N-terminal domain-containing protein n=1 Tax=Moraxella sp. TaxID=479 RepID=UPI0026DBFAD2|nr:glutathione S-transferase N-terminal domain-containing protein [Moraxella sp.]MDO4450584.1 glutathione S-transferase N-terminal domain-containing protein [Moraxella sp.]